MVCLSRHTHGGQKREGHAKFVSGTVKDGSHGEVSISQERRYMRVDGKGVAERRGHLRFRAQDLTFATFGTHGKEVGEIVDISMGGLAFLYIANGDQIHTSGHLEIFAAHNGFHLSEVPFTTISDFALPNEFPTSLIIMMRCGVEFVELTETQVSQLGYFIKHHTVSEV